jgi:hypothetical protein
MPARRFPPPWSVKELDACFVVRDQNGQQLAYVYFEDEPGQAVSAKLLTKDEARPALDVRPHDENYNSRAQRQQQREAEIVFCSVHLNETSGATARAGCSRSSLRIMSLSAE